MACEDRRSQLRQSNVARQNRIADARDRLEAIMEGRPDPGPSVRLDSKGRMSTPPSAWLIVGRRSRILDVVETCAVEPRGRGRQETARRALRLRGYTIDEGHAPLAAEPETHNRNTGKPWARSIIGRDLAALDGKWKQRALEDVAERKAFYGAKLAELQKQAWRNNSLALVLKTMEREAKLFGLDTPTKVAPTTPDGMREYTGGRIR